MKSARLLKAAAVCLVAAFTIALSPKVAPAAPDARSSRVPNIVLSGKSYDGRAKLISGVTYVWIREFSEGLGAEVTWDNPTRTAKVKTNYIELTAADKASYVKSNGKTINCARGIFIENGRMYVPLRAIGTAFGFETTWNNSDFRATLTKKDSTAQNYSSDDLYWLSRIISAEAKGESMNGKMAVGTVVLNRVKSSEFPNTIYGVIFDRNGGVQFTPVANGEIYKTPDSESVEAAKRCLEGQTLSSDILFFINTDIAESFWITNNRQYVMTIGNHDFYA